MMQSLINEANLKQEKKKSKKKWVVKQEQCNRERRRIKNSGICRRHDYEYLVLLHSSFPWESDTLNDRHYRKLMNSLN